MRALMAIGTLLLLGACGTAGKHVAVQAEPSPEHADVATPAPAFDEVPGLGRSPEAQQRDEAIAIWEAWRRETHMSACMRGVGFDYWPDVEYPRTDVDTTRALLGVSPDSSSTSRPGARNRHYRDALSRVDQDRYWRALLGISLDDVESGRGNIDKEGCYADAWSAVGSVWDLKGRLADDLREITARAHDSAYRSAVHDLQVELIASEPLVSAQKERYRDALEQAGADAEFLRYLAEL